MKGRKCEIVKYIIRIIIYILLAIISIVLILRQPPKTTPEYIGEIRSIMEDTK